MINVILADDHFLVRDGIKALLEDQTGITVIDEASNGKEALEVVSKNKPHILIVDIRMPEMSGIEVVAEINKHHKDVKTLVLSMHDSEEYVVKSIQAGADGYLLKGASKEEFLKALNKVASGGKYFTGDVSSIIMNNFVNGNISKTAATQKEITPRKQLRFLLTFPFACASRAHMNVIDCLYRCRYQCRRAELQVSCSSNRAADSPLVGE